MWEGLADGTIESVASDHVPRKRATKEKPMWQASQGFPGTATILPVLLSEGYHKGRISLQRVCDSITAAPARIFDLADRKGNIRVGLDGDITHRRPRPRAPGRSGRRSARTPTTASTKAGSSRAGPTHTIVRGEMVMENGKIVGRPGLGKYLRRAL